MNVKILSCEIFKPYIEVLLKEERLPYTYELTYYEMDQHNQPKEFHQLLQSKIDESKGFDMVLLLYGICGNVTSHLKATHCPLLIPKVHDCATVLLGGKSRFIEIFGERLSTPWMALAHDENHSDHQYLGDDNEKLLEERYGKDNAAYLRQFFEANASKKLYLSLGLEEDEKRIASLDDIEVVLGNIKYIKDILFLKSDDLLKLDIGEKMVPLYDHETVMTKSKH